MFSKLRNSLRKPKPIEKDQVTIVLPELKEVERLGRRPSSDSTDTVTATNKIEEAQNDPVKQLSQLNDELYKLDIASYLSLRLLLETKLGRGAHVNGEVMSCLRRNVESILAAYMRFSQIIAEAVKYKYAKDNLAMALQARADIVLPVLNQAVSSSSDSVIEIKNPTLPSTQSNESGLESKYSPTQVFGVSIQALSSFRESLANDVKEQPEITEAHMEKLMLEANDLFQVLVRHIQQTQDVIIAQRSKINPQAILNSQTEFGNLQKFFVHTRYKEMVKGCGPARVNHTGIVAWAGATDPGDAWMNQLLQSFWRHCVPRHPYEKIHKKLRQKPQEDATQSTDNEETLTDMAITVADEIAKEEASRKNIELIQQKLQNPAAFDVVDVQELFKWVKKAKQKPMSQEHTHQSIEVVEAAVEKMGGWEYFDVFCLNWLRQFSMEYGKLSVAFPLHGCRPLTPESQCPPTPSFNDAPLSVSLSDLFQSLEYHTPQIPSQQNNMLKVPVNDDEKYWNFAWKQTCKDLLMLHKTLAAESLSDVSAIKEWLSEVNDCGILQYGKYKEYTLVEDSSLGDDSITSQQRFLIHPSLVRLREKAIILNICAKPDFIKYMVGVDQAIRAESKNKLTESFVAAIERLPERTEAIELAGESSEPFKKGHRKSSSTGIFNRTNVFGKKKKSEGSPDVKGKQSQLSLARLSFGNIPLLKNDDPRTPRPLQNDSLPRPIGNGSLRDSNGTITKRSLSAPTSPAQIDVNPQATDFGEIKQMCEEIVTFSELPDVDLLRKAFEMSEIIVKHYLTEEIPAKYQSLY